MRAKKKLSRVDQLERALSVFCCFHVAVSRALDEGTGDGDCHLDKWICSLGAAADRSLRGLSPIRPKNISKHWKQLHRREKEMFEPSADEPRAAPAAPEVQSEDSAGKEGEK